MLSTRFNSGRTNAFGSAGGGSLNSGFVTFRNFGSSGSTTGGGSGFSISSIFGTFFSVGLTNLPARSVLGDFSTFGGGFCTGFN